MNGTEPVLTVGISDRIDLANAPRPTNEGERLMFRQLYETLVRIDCHGRPIPGLAASWRLEDDGQTWILTLRENARFADGVLVTANDVRAGWLRDRVGDELHPRVSGLLRSATALNDREIAIVLQRYRPEAPIALAHEDLAVARRVTPSSSAIGTRASSVRFVEAPGDPRDLLDRGVDLLFTRDPATLGYAATLPRYQFVPVAWQRTRLLLTPVPLRSSPAPDPATRQLLATDAVRGEARGALGPVWWDNPECSVAPPFTAAGRPSPSTRVVYDANDGASRDLAERLVGLRVFQRAMGLRGEALTTAIRRGSDAGFIVSVVTDPLEPCYELQGLMDAAPWLERRTMIVPLVDTRLQAIVRRGASGITVDGDGGVLLTEMPAASPQ